MTRLFNLIILLLLLFITTKAAYIKDFPVTLTQPDNTIIECFITGDEFFRRLHDAEGYTIVKDNISGYYKYAEKINGKLFPSKYIVGQSNIKNFNIPKNLMPDNKDENNFHDYYKASLLNAQKTTNVKYANSTLGVKTLNNLVIFIRFSDDVEYTESITKYDNMFNCQDNCNSMYNYYKQVSYNQLEMNSFFYPVQNSSTVLSFKDNNPRSYYQPYSNTNPNGYKDNDEYRIREHSLIKNSIESLKASIPSDLNLDYNNDGLVDNICFIIKGKPDNWSNLLWPHRWMLYSYEVKINEKFVFDYNFQLEGTLNENGMGVGVLCHEMFHTLGAPDLYHYNESYLDLSPVGIWDIMEQTSNPPQSMGAYMKLKYGKWISSIPEISKTGTYYVKPISSVDKNCYMIASPKSTQEYFVIEYRKNNSLFDGTLPGSGILIYRINKTSEGYGNMSYPDKPDEVYIFRPNGTKDNSGYINDAYFSNNTTRTEFNNSTNPACFLSDGSAGDVYISNIAINDTAAFFNVTFSDIPIADFSANYTIVQPDQVVNFKDLTSGLPNVWDWTFEGATPSTSSVQNPQNIIYNTPGLYTVSLKASNNKGTNTKTKTAYINVLPKNTDLDCQNSIELTSGVKYSGNNVNGLNNVNNYSCAPNKAYKGKEILHSITTNIRSDLKITLTDNACNLDLFVLNSCADVNCIAYSDSGSIILKNTEAGTYYIVVDGGDNSNDCSYSIMAEVKEKDTLICNTAQNLIAGFVYGSSTIGTSNNINKYSCDTTYMSGNEKIFKIELEQISTINLNVTKNLCDLNIYLFNECTLQSCIAFGKKTLKNYNTVPGTYYVVIDGYDQNNCDFNISYNYYIDTIQHTQAQKLTCNQTIAGNTTSGTNYTEKYQCENNILNGKENVYVINITKTTDINAILKSGSEQLEVLILNDIYSNNCVALGYYNEISQAQIATVKDALPGKYYIVVDGKNNYSGAYELKVNFPLFDYKKINDTVICKDDSLLIEAYGGDKYYWSFGDSSSSIKIKPTVSTSYSLSISNNGCMAIQEAKVDIIDINVSTADTIEICKNTNYNINLNFGDLSGNFIKVTYPKIEFINYAIALFGYEVKNSYISGKIEYKKDLADSYNGCSQSGYYTNAFKNKIALIDRGDCFFSLKAYMAQIAGAKAVIIINNETGNGTVSMAAGNYGELINIPFIMIGNQDGTILKDIILSSDSVNIVVGFNGYPKTFEWSPDFNINNISLANPIININTDTSYSVKINSMGCINNKTIRFKVLDNSLIANAGSDMTINQDESINLTSTPASKYSWSSGDTSQSITITPIYNALYSLTISDGICKATDQIEITVKRHINDTFTITPPSWYYSCSDFYTTNFIDNYLPIDTGFINGNNILGDLEKAQKFNIFSKNGWLNSVNIYIRYKDVRTNENVYVYIYEEDTITKSPKGNYLAKSLPIRLQDIDTSGLNLFKNTFYFEEPVKLPETFFVSVVLPQDTFFGESSNKIAILSTYGSSSDSLSWEKWNDSTWHSILSYWKANIDFAMTSKINFKDTCYAFAGKDTSICGSTPISICGTGGDFYSWSSNEIATCISVLPSITTTYTLTTFNGYCFATDNIVVEVNATKLSDDKLLCNTESTSLYADYADKYIWSTGDTIPYLNVTPTQKITKYTITTHKNACISSDEIIITKIIIPEKNAGTDQAICKGGQINLIATGGESYLWNTGDTTNQITVIPSNSTTYILTTTNMGCSQIDSAFITVKPIPVINIGSDKTIDSGKNLIISASGGDSYTWNTGSNQAVLIVKPTTLTTYSVTITNNGCTASDYMVVFITSITENGNNIRELIKIYPNPANEYIMIELPDNDYADISILDNLGKTILNKNINNTKLNKIDIMYLSKGYYNIRVIMKDTIVNVPFIKQ